MEIEKMSRSDVASLALFYEERRPGFNPLQHRLANEHLLVEELSHSHVGIDYELINDTEFPPMAYRVSFKGLKSIVGIDQDQLPLFGSSHLLDIRLSADFPLEPPVCYMLTRTWHPNIQSDPGPFQGRICGNTEGFGAFYSLDRLILRIRSMLAWKSYHAEMRDPYPEDEDVARWVREVAEPLGVVAQDSGITPGWVLPTNWKELIVQESKIKISLVR